jgi:hypothetical protein
VLNMAVNYSNSMNQSQKNIVFLIIVCIIIYNSCALSKPDRRQNSEYQMAKRITKNELPMFFNKIEIGTVPGKHLIMSTPNYYFINLLLAFIQCDQG